jgi:hypothetical protein
VRGFDCNRCYLLRYGIGHGGHADDSLEKHSLTFLGSMIGFYYDDVLASEFSPIHKVVSTMPITHVPVDMFGLCWLPLSSGVSE